MDEFSLIKKASVVCPSGVRVILLNCLARFGRPVLLQAAELGMTESGWAWIVTDGITGSVSTRLGAR